MKYWCIQKMENSPKRNSGRPIQIFRIRKYGVFINVENEDYGYILVVWHTWVWEYLEKVSGYICRS